MRRLHTLFDPIARAYRSSAWLAVAAATLVGCAAAPASSPTSPASTQTASPAVTVKVIAINDFHGNLKPPLGGARIRDPLDRTRLVQVSAGGAEHLATAVAQLRAQNPNSIFVGAGDLVGATPLLSALFYDEPTIESLSLMGLDISAVGNHEFDRGSAELLRLQRGGCHPKDGCKGPKNFTGATFKYLAASTVDERTGRTVLPAYEIRRFDGVPIAFIGLTLAATPSIVVPSGVAGLKFRDEAQTVNELVPQLQRLGVNAFVVLLHEGGFPAGDYNECPGISGPIVNIVKKLDPAVQVVVSGHTHRAYNCRIDDKLVTSADKYGTMLTNMDLTLDRKSGRITGMRADNVVVRTEGFAKDARQTQLIAAYEQLAQPLAKRVVGRLNSALSSSSNPAGESPLGRVIADAQLAATQAPENGGAQIAFMNPGGIRASLAPQANGDVRYEDLFAVQPFYNNLVTMTLTGAQIVDLLEQQWARQPNARLLLVSRGFAYTWDAQRPPGQRVVAGSVTLGGKPLEPQGSYRVTVNSFLAEGGDNFQALRQGAQRRTGVMDVDALESYIARGGTAQLDAQARITRLN